jgi:hypothetical protein
MTVPYITDIAARSFADRRSNRRSDPRRSRWLTLALVVASAFVVHRFIERGGQ